MWFDTILWLVAVVAFIMVEAATTALVSVWFAVGAAAAMLVSFFDVGFGWQMLVFAVVSAITLGLMLPRLISRRGAHRAPVTNGSPLTIGKQALCLWTLSPAFRAGSAWTAWTAGQARRRQVTTCPRGTRCKVVAVDGAILIVAPVTADAAAV